jgi:hypothetical protein
MLTPCEEGERLAAGPFDMLCIIQERSGSFYAAILEARDIPGFPHPDQLPTIELEIGMMSTPNSLAHARACAEAFAERYGFEDPNIVTDRIILLDGPPTPIIIQNWNCEDKATTARSALFSVVDSITV